jgi:hypothetical protein
MDGWTAGWLAGRTNRQRERWMDGCVGACVRGWMDARMAGWTDRYLGENYLVTS